MYRGLVISVVAHLGALAWALISIHTAELPKPPVVEPVAVSIVTPDDITRLTKGDRNAKLLEAEPVVSKASEEQPKEKPKPTPKATAEPPPPPPEPEPPEPEPPKPEEKQAEAKPEPPPPPEPQKDPIAEKMAALAKEPPPEPKPDPGPTPEELAAKKAAEEAARKAEEQKKAEEKKKAEDKKKAEELKKKQLAEAKKKREEAAKKKREAEAKKKQFDADKLAALLNKIPDSGGPKAAADAPKTPTKARGPVAGAPDGRDDRLTASEMALLGAMIRRGVQPCWRVLGGGQGAEAMAVKMRIQFNPDGTLKGEPQIMNAQPSPFFVAAADSAKRAVIQCQPYSLPADKYVAWQDVILNFDPKDMF